MATKKQTKAKPARKPRVVTLPPLVAEMVGRATAITREPFPDAYSAMDLCEAIAASYRMRMAGNSPNDGAVAIYMDYIHRLEIVRAIDRLTAAIEALTKPMP